MARRTRRLWRDEERWSICLQTNAPGVSVAQVALRYTVNANPIFKWLRDPRYRPKPETGSEEAGFRFLPVETVAEARAPAAAPAVASCIEIKIAGGHRMRSSGNHDPEVLARLIRGLSVCFRFRPTRVSGCGRGDGHAKGGRGPGSAGRKCAEARPVRRTSVRLP